MSSGTAASPRWSRQAVRFLLPGYLVVLVLLLAWPFDFDCWICVNGASWAPNGAGISLASRGVLRSVAPPAALGRRIAAEGSFSVETWVAAARADQTGPARIVSYSADSLHRNFTIGQENAELVVRVRTSGGDANGRTGEMHVPDVFAPGRLRHIVVTYDAARRCAYVDGALRRCAPPIGGTLAGWDLGYPLLIGNEATGDRPWLGRLAQVAIFGRALTAVEVAERYRAGAAAAETGAPLALFRFAEGEGRVARDTGGLEPASDLALPQTLMNGAMLPPLDLKARAVSDFFENFALYLPLGFLLCLGMVRRRGAAPGAVAAFLAAVAICCVLEFLQVFVASRTSSLVDLASGAVGAAIGVAVAVALRPNGAARGVLPG